jgi:hypothetical protein
MEIGQWSLFQGSVPTFQVYNNASVRSIKVRLKAVLDPVTWQIYVWELSFNSVTFVSNSVIQRYKFLPVV